MDRKEFLSTGAILGAMTIAPGGKIASQIKDDPMEENLYLDIPVFCSHEHWGSISSIGQFPGGFNADLRPGALPQRETTLVDLLVDPYMAGSLMGNGFNPLNKERNQPLAYTELLEALKNFRLKGTFLSLRLGINLAYGYDILKPDPVDAKSWREFLEKLFNRIEAQGCLGIKQLQAYHRNLDFEPVDDQSVVFRGELNELEKKRFQDWVVHACCELANQRQWPHQVHVGTHNHPLSNPLPLSSLARRYPDQKIVMLHCWPYLEEAGYLAQAHPNVFMDTCWQPILNPDFLRQSLQTWLGYIPLNKITMSNDSTSVEMAAGASMIARKVLKETLIKQKSQAGLKEHEEYEIAAQLLHNNAVDIYGLGTKHFKN